jgi:ribosome-associated toxin RatA of RatAB toxin-antitoxin module
VNDAPSTPRPRVLVHEATVTAPAATLLALVEDVAAGPHFFPSHLHAEVLDDGLVRRWVVADGAVRAWTVHRSVDRTAGRILFTHHEPRPPVRSIRGTWSFTPLTGTTTRVEVRHDLDVTDPEAGARMAADLDRNVPRQLAGYADVAQNREFLNGLLVTARTSVVVANPPAEAFAALRDAPEPGRDGDTAPYPAVRLPLPDAAVPTVVTKDSGCPEWLRSYVTQLTFRRTGRRGTLVTARHTALPAARTGRRQAEELVAARLRDQFRGLC